MLKSGIIMSKNTIFPDKNGGKSLFDVRISGFDYVERIDFWNYTNVNSHCWRLYWNREKGAFLKENGKKIFLTPDTVILIPPYTTFTSSMTKPFPHFYIHFSAPAPFDHVKRGIITLPAGNISFHAEELRNDRSEPNLSLHLRLIIYSCFLSFPKERFLPQEKTILDPRIKRAIDIMSSEPGSRHTCKEICRRTGLSLNTFYALFKKETGMTSKNYLLSIRMEKALSLLLHSDLSIKEIAEKTAFSDRYHFSKVFKSFFKTAPVAYRKQYAGRGKVLFD